MLWNVTGFRAAAFSPQHHGLMAKGLRVVVYPVAHGCVAEQVENEYGYCGSDSSYIRHLIQVAGGILGNDVILYTTDPPTLAAAGSVPGSEVYT